MTTENLTFFASEACKKIPQDAKYPGIVPAVVTSQWHKYENRVLILIERPDPEDVTQKKLMSPTRGRGRDTVVNATTNSVVGVINYALSENRQLENTTAFGVAIFSSSNWPAVLAELAPTKVLLCGFKCGGFLFPNDEFLKYRHGNPVEHAGVLYCQTLPIDQLLYTEDEEDSESSRADLLYMVSRALSNLLKGRNPDSLAKLVAKPIMVDTMKKASRLFELLDSTNEWSLDIETDNLSTYHNRVLTVQFAVGVNEGYVLPLQHKDTPFTTAEYKELRIKLRKLMGGTGKLIYLFNGKFDLRVLRGYLKLPVIYHDVWEVTAGEHLLDENISLLDRISFRGLGGESIKLHFGNLRNMLCYYGNDAFYKMPFSKEQRATISTVNLMESKDCQDYTAMDAQATLGIGLAQRQRAKRTKVFVKGEFVNFSSMFERHVIHQMGPTVKTLSTMEEYGTFTDMAYIKELQDPALSKLVPLMASLKKRLLALDSVKLAEKEINKEAGRTSNSLFAVSSNTSVFSIKPKHLAVLFFNVLGLKPLRRTKTGAPSADKDFLAEHLDTYEEAQLVSEYSEANKLLSTYVGSWHKCILDNLDSAVDFCLRPSFGFFYVVTGRLSSFDPNLQNVPTRGKLAKIIKRLTVSPRGHLSPRWDFSAHEVRMWGNSANDVSVSESFIQGLKLRRKFLVTPTEEIAGVLKKKGDFHILNVHRFFKKWVDKSNPLRDAVKGVVFGKRVEKLKCLAIG